jgi:hypothetical protein
LWRRNGGSITVMLSIILSCIILMQNVLFGILQQHAINQDLQNAALAAARSALTQFNYTLSKFGIYALDAEELNRDEAFKRSLVELVKASVNEDVARFVDLDMISELQVEIIGNRSLLEMNESLAFDGGGMQYVTVYESQIYEEMKYKAPLYWTAALTDILYNPQSQAVGANMKQEEHPESVTCYTSDGTKVEANDKASCSYNVVTKEHEMRWTAIHDMLRASRSIEPLAYTKVPMDALNAAIDQAESEEEIDQAFEEYKRQFILEHHAMESQVARLEQAIRNLEQAINQLIRANEEVAERVEEIADELGLRERDQSEMDTYRQQALANLQGMVLQVDGLHAVLDELRQLKGLIETHSSHLPPDNPIHHVQSPDAWHAMEESYYQSLEAASRAVNEKIGELLTSFERESFSIQDRMRQLDEALEEGRSRQEELEGNLLNNLLGQFESLLKLIRQTLEEACTEQTNQLIKDAEKLQKDLANRGSSLGDNLRLLVDVFTFIQKAINTVAGEQNNFETLREREQNYRHAIEQARSEAIEERQLFLDDFTSGRDHRGGIARFLGMMKHRVAGFFSYLGNASVQRAYLAEYALTKFHHVTMNRMADEAPSLKPFSIANSYESTGRQDTGKQFESVIGGEEAEYILFGIPMSCTNFVAAMSWIFGIRLAEHYVATAKEFNTILLAFSFGLSEIVHIAYSATHAVLDLIALLRNEEIPFWPRTPMQTMAHAIHNKAVQGIGGGAAACTGVCFSYRDFLRLLYLVLPAGSEQRVVRMAALTTEIANRKDGTTIDFSNMHTGVKLVLHVKFRRSGLIQNLVLGNERTYEVLLRY